MDCSSKPRKNMSTTRTSLRTLMREDSRDPPSCSSSESDDLDRVPTEIYCAWTPKSAAASEVKKSDSTGSMWKWWRIRNLLFRSNSDGSGRDSVVKAAHKEDDYAKGGVAVKDGERRRLYRRQDWVGFFANVNGVSNNLQLGGVLPCWWRNSWN